MDTFSTLLLEYTKEKIQKIRSEKEAQQNLTKSLTTLMNKQKEKPRKAWQAHIYTIYGGGATIVYSFAPNVSEAIKEIESLPYFKKFMKRPVRVELNF